MRMAEEHSTETELLRELRRIRYALCGLILVLAVMFLAATLDMWAKSTSPPNTASQELRAIEGELRAIRNELSMRRNQSMFPPIVMPAGKPLKADTSNTKEMLVGKWKHEKDKTVITLEFAADKLSYRNNRLDAGPPGETPYKVLDDKTLEMPQLGVAPLIEKVTIDSLSADKLVLSGGDSWKFDKTEFTKQK
jgi:hypothetical protein